MAAGDRKQIICMKWGTKFPAEDVNRLYRMVQANMTDAFDFYCVTDHAEGIGPEVKVLPLPEVPVVGGRLDRGWRKLGLFDPDLAGPKGRTLYLDLDIVITRPLDPFFEGPGRFVIIKDYKLFRRRHAYTGNSSVLRYEAGNDLGVYDELSKLSNDVFTDFRNEQEFLSYIATRHGILEYWPGRWCVSYKHDCVYLVPMGLVLPPRLPKEARVIVFHGDPKPSEAVEGSGSKWYRVVKPAPWLREYMS